MRVATVRTADRLIKRSSVSPSLIRTNPFGFRLAGALIGALSGAVSSGLTPAGGLRGGRLCRSWCEPLATATTGANPRKWIGLTVNAFS